jgi:hypothetical protein
MLYVVGHFIPANSIFPLIIVRERGSLSPL